MLEKANKIEKYIYTFSEITPQMHNIIGNKAVNLAILFAYNPSIVPMGIVISTELVKFVRDKKQYPYHFIEELQIYLKKIEEKSGKIFGDPNNPLLLSVRSSGNVSLPGILETILNVGINDNIREKWNVDKTFKEEIYNHNVCKKFDNPMDQLLQAIDMVINSIDSDKFQDYDFEYTMKKNFTMGIVIQEMVFGNRDDNSYTGVIFSSDKTGTKIFGEVLFKSQGDAIVNGTVTPLPIENLPRFLYKNLSKIAKELERKFTYIQDMEFTIENGQLYILQTRKAQLTNLEKFQMWERFVKEGLIEPKEFFQQIPSLDQVKNKRINYQREKPTILGRGIGITDSVICGYLAMDYNTIMQLKKEGKNAIYATVETNQKHMKCLMQANGLITVKGGATSHSAVVARGRNMVCVLSVKSLEILAHGINIEGKFIGNNEPLTLDGAHGYILNGGVKWEEGAEHLESCNWKLSNVEVKMNGETLENIVNGHKFMMNGIGLCRLEHMLLDEEGKIFFQNFILKNNKNNEDILCEYLKKSFINIFKAMKNLPISIRLIDPPLHEFFPIDSLMEHNPMMGNRGARLLIMEENLCKLQMKAIFSAHMESKTTSTLEIMVPFIFGIKELQFIKNLIKKVWLDFPTISYKFGVMIEIPRAIFIADKLAEEVDFIAFGTNDLTQMVFGLSRDDSGNIIQKYMDNKILDFDPFQQLDRVVCDLLELAISKGRSVKPHMIFGICGEQAVHEASIELLYKMGINYISCSPFNIEKVRFNLNKIAVMNSNN